ncbi:Amuc_1102 family pilus-like protein [Prosthecobacter sp.]|uniref:Amuc_1102 family pilus-like protein n=1 Tax=Prosthecobacter sp. TaxID=1965333 RepID=UPI002ABCBCB0|nr:Amuc_1102 family pilus-like protein [Prosthecobacter sp.]MDZ4403855.1 Amuc_1102 family pilus-like protein [Prosthecobacter sp.]
MKLFALSIAPLFIASALYAQAPAVQETLPAVKVDIKRVTVTEQPTPQFTASNVKEKRWRPKNWIEVDVEFDIKVPVDAGGRNGSYSAMQLNVYLALQHMTKDGKREVITGTLDLLNIPAGETCHALAYVSPATMRSIFLKDNVTASTDIQGWGVEFIAEGKRIAGDSSVGKSPWWEKTENFAMLQGSLLNKLQTPFAPLWGDYDVPVKAK